MLHLITGHSEQKYWCLLNAFASSTGIKWNILVKNYVWHIIASCESFSKHSILPWYILVFSRAAEHFQYLNWKDVFLQQWSILTSTRVLCSGSSALVFRQLVRAISFIDRCIYASEKHQVFCLSCKKCHWTSTLVDSNVDTYSIPGPVVQSLIRKPFVAILSDTGSSY